MGALLGTAGLHSMKTKCLSALLLARLRLWVATLIWNQLWVSTLLAVLGEVLGETWQAGFVAICLTTAHSAPHGDPPGQRRFTFNENKIFVSFTFGSVSAFCVHFGWKSALCVILLAVLGKVLGETWQAGFVAICLTTAHSAPHGGLPGHRRFTLNENKIFVSFAFGAVSALGVRFGLESALGVHFVASSWEGLGRNVASRFVGICLTTAHSVTHGGPPGHRRFTLNENNIFVSFAFGSFSALGVHFGLESALGVHSVGGSWGGLGRIMASRACRHLPDYRPLGTTWGPSWAPPLHTQ